MRKERLKIICLFLLLIPVTFLYAQVSKPDFTITRDTSFTLYGTIQKISKDYPEAKPVHPLLPDGVVEKRNIVYESYGNRELHLDIFSPVQKVKKIYPGIILVHGGGWRSGDRSMEIPMAQKIASCGYITAVVEYRLSPEAKYPASIYDLKSAIRWMRANAVKYNIDAKKIGAYGCSSGGHLVSLLGVTNGNKKYDGVGSNLQYPSTLQAVVNIDGILDFTDPAESGKDNDPQKPSVGKLWLGYSFKENPDIWREASPLNYVEKNAPPFLFINSSLDRFHAGREQFIAKLNSFNIYSEVHTIQNTPHPFWLFHPWFEDVFNYIRNFLDKKLRGKN